MRDGAWSILGREALRIVLPSWCAACDSELPWSERKASCCAACWSSLPRIDTPKCTSCALPMADTIVGPSRCLDCQIDPLPVDWCEAWGHYRGSLEKLLHAFKFERHDFLDAPLASLMETTLRARGDLAFDAIVPVPMHRAKERRRGYNQAELLARALAKNAGIACEPSLLHKCVDRGVQSKLNRRQRAENVRGAFEARGARGRAVLLVDDICTTGETLRACAAALLRAGAARVAAITVAKAGA